jgi:hypothetical protein
LRRDLIPVPRKLVRKGWIAATLVGLAVASGGCGGDDSDSGSDGTASGPDGAALVEPFNALAEQAYEGAGKDRQTDYTSGVTLDVGCPLADDEAA